MYRMTTSASNRQPPSGSGIADRLLLLSVYSAALAFPAMTLSISGTQILIALAFVSYAAALFAGRWQARQTSVENRGLPSLRSLPAVWLIGGALFAWLLLSGLVHAAIDALSATDILVPDARSSPGAAPAGGLSAFADAIRRGARGEWGDVPLLLFGLLVFVHARQSSAHRRILFGGLTAAFALLIVGGFVAMFSEFRLARLVPHHIAQLMPGAEAAELVASAKNRPQHPYTQLGDWTLYRPIGFMNTRLTFAGLLMLMLPWAAGRAFLPAATPIPRRALWAAAVGIGVLLLLVNGTRSILAGAAVTAAFGGYLWLRQLVLLQNQASDNQSATVSASSFSIRKLLARQGNGRRMLAAGIVLVIAGTGSVLYFASDAGRLQSNRLLARVQRHTDFARPILWTVAGELALQNPVLGAGPGNFERAGLAWREDFVRENPETLYFFRNTPRGHAHNDLLHLAATGGLPAALLFLILAFFTVRRLFESDDPGELRRAGLPTRLATVRDDWLLLGTLGFFAAGIAQCYFQDDEVATLYWALLGLGTAPRER